MKYVEQMEGVCQKASSQTNTSKSQYSPSLTQYEMF